MKLTRRFLFPALVLGAALAHAASAATDSQTTAQLFNIKDKTQLLHALGAQSAKPSDAIRLSLPTLAENASLIPIMVQSQLPNTESIAIVMEENPTPLAAVFHPTAKPDGEINARVRTFKTGNVHAVVRAGGQTYIKTAVLKITRGGCGDASVTINTDTRHSQAKINSTVRGETVTLKSLIQHPMENGLRMDDKGIMAVGHDAKTGKPIQPHYIQQVVAEVEGKPVFDAQWGPSIASNPFLSFDLPRPATEQTLVLRWKDNLGKTGQFSHALRN